MYITWLGHSCFRLESAGYGLVIDPYRVVAGYPGGDQRRLYQPPPL